MEGGARARTHRLRLSGRLKATLFFTLLVLEVGIAGYLLFYLHKKPVSSVPIKKSEVVFPESGFKFFYEPLANATIKEEVSGGIKTINSDTLNERFEYPVEKGGGVFRIITLGDSFTYGAFESTSDNYPEQLEDALNRLCKNGKFEVINLGMNGYDIDYEIERYRLRGVKYEPDLVLWYVKDDDFDVPPELIWSIMDGYTQEERHAFEEKDRKNSLTNSGYAHATDVVKNTYGKEVLVQRARLSMEKIKTLYGGKLLIFNSGRHGRFNEEIADFAAQTPNAEFYRDLGSIYADADNYWPDTHPTKSGYALIAEDLRTYLVTRGYFECKGA